MRKPSVFARYAPLTHETKKSKCLQENCEIKCFFLTLIPAPKMEDKLNPVVPNAPFLYPLKTLENLTVF